MDLIIGRDANTAQLKVVNGTQVTLIGAPASVPMDVSRQHCKLEVIDKDTFVITNIKAANVTWVNGVEVQSKQITLADKVQLGASKYVLPLAEIAGKVVPTIVDITPLKVVWENYKNGIKDIKKRQQRNNLIASSYIGLSILGGLLTFLIPSELQESVKGIIGFFAALLFAYGFYKRATFKGDDEQEKLIQKLHDEYVCPNCNYFFEKGYDILSKNFTCCPGCKAQFKK